MIYSAHFDGFVIGDQGDDTVNGTEENELLMGGAGDDVLNGGLGSDVLAGGDGSDRFICRDFYETELEIELPNVPCRTPQLLKRDIITDFSSSEDDKIDLSAIDEGFVFIGSSDFSGARNEIRFDDSVLQISSFCESDASPAPVF